VIFATVGSHPTYVFDRFLRALEGLPDDELVVQYGPGVPPPNASRAVPWMSFAEIVENMEAATHVVSHAGVGTILCAARVGHVPVVLPRLRRFGETVDDHQVELGRRLAGDGRVILVEEDADLVECLRGAPPRAREPDFGHGRLVEAVRAELIGGR
jgi:UDP-N-acetylglucosamine transferase subunit ALG13